MPDYVGLTRLLLEPLLDAGSELKIDCETTRGGQRILLRVSFDPASKGRVFGRGGRTIHAVRQVLTASAQLVDQNVQLDVGDHPSSGERPKTKKRN
ncbi:MAG: KH domain-containing protein [Synechococcus sp.]